MSYIVPSYVCVVINPEPNTTITITYGPGRINVSYREGIDSERERMLPDRSNERLLRRRIEKEFEYYNLLGYPGVFG